MTRADRRRAVLRFLADNGLALPPKAIYRNLRWRHNATFAERSTTNYLAALAEDGLVRRVDPEALENRQLVDVEDQRAYYVITDEGRDLLRN